MCMEQDKAYYEALLTKVFQGLATEAEKAQVAQWLYAMELSGRQVKQEELDQAKAQMLENILSQPQPTAASRRKAILLTRWPARTAVAAAAIVLVMLGYYLFSLIQIKKQAGEPVQYAASVTTDSVVKRVVLPDGSKVWLNANSRLEYDQQEFGKAVRAIRLNGEAYFEVQRNTLKPFIVSSGNINTRVLGTAFTVQNYSGDAGIKVTLVHGSVAVEETASRKQTLLKPDQQLQYSRLNKEWQIIACHRNPASNWMNGHLAFREISLQEVLDDLSHRYNRQIIYDRKQVDHKTVTTTIAGHERLEDVLSDILFIHRLGYYDRDGILYITGQ